MESILGRVMRIGCALMLGMIAASRLFAADDDKQVPATRPADLAEIVVGKPPYEVVPIKLPPPAYRSWIGQLPRSPWLRPWASKLRPPFKAPVGTTNLALKCPVTSSDKEPVVGELKQITDGDKRLDEGSWIELNPGVQWVQIDLGKPAEIYGICMWHAFDPPNWVFKGVVVQLCDDPEFKSQATTVFNNDRENLTGLGVGTDMQYLESFQGELVPIKEGLRARYVRLYSKGNLQNEANRYTEVEVYGIAR